MFHVLLLIALIGGSSQLMFIYLLRPVIIQRLRFSIFALRDELRLRAIKKEIPEEAKAYRILESHLNKSVNIVANIDLADLILMKFDTPEVLQAKEALAIIDESSAEIRSIHQNAMKCILAAFIVNSPILFCIIPVLLFFSLFIYRAQNLVEYLKARAWTASGDSSQCFA